MTNYTPPFWGVKPIVFRRRHNYWQQHHRTLISFLCQTLSKRTVSSGLEIPVSKQVFCWDLVPGVPFSWFPISSPFSPSHVRRDGDSGYNVKWETIGSKISVTSPWSSLPLCVSNHSQMWFCLVWRPLVSLNLCYMCFQSVLSFLVPMTEIVTAVTLCFR